MPTPRTLIWSGLFLLAFVSAVAWGSIPTLQSEPLMRVALFAVMGLCLPGLVLFFPDLTGKRTLMLLLGSAILLRLALLPASHSDDVHRYLWEGKLVLAGENPYAVTADDASRDSYHDVHRAAMNHPDKFTIYPPGSQWLFAAVAAIDYQPRTAKLLVLLGDLVTLLVLLRFLKIECAPLRWAGFYAFNPVVLVGYAAEGHSDSLMIAALLGALLASRTGRHVLAWLCLGLAIQFKLICVVLLPLFLDRRSWRSALVIVPVLVIPSLPFLNALESWVRGVASFASGGVFNSPILSFFQYFEFFESASRKGSAPVFLLVLVVVWIARRRGLPLLDACLVVLGALILLSPIVHFWYLAWILPLVALRPSLGWTVASVTAAGYFLAWWTLEQSDSWGFGQGTPALLWTPVLLAFAAQHRSLPARVFHAWRNPAPAVHPESIGIVIPTLDPGPSLPALVADLRTELGVDSPIIIADASRTSPPEMPVRVVSCQRGRGNQIAAGIAAMDAEWIVIVHADALPRPGWHAALRSAIQAHPQAAMLVFGQRFDRSGFASTVIEAMNEARVILGGVAFGDQTMVVRRSALATCGGFPAQPLMEDVEASLRLATRGRAVYLGHEWCVSAVKLQSHILRRILMVFRLVATYQLARLRGRAHAAACASRLYREYYPGA
ncbi:MAG: glycosyltransferase 87 family protein [Luteolibacter sp.]